jgi:hypothetical protein
MVPVSLDLILKNNSAVSARFPYLILRVDRGRYLSMGHQYQKIAANGFLIARSGPIESRHVLADPGSISRDTEFSGGANCCVHPGTTLQIASVKLDAPAHLQSYQQNSSPTQSQLEPRYDELPTVIMEVSYGCLDSPCERVSMELSAAEMQAKLLSNGLCGPVVLP